MAKTAVGGDDERPNKWEKFKKSPAAQDYKKKGAKYVAKNIGSMAADAAASAASKASYHLGLTDNPSGAHAASPAMRNRGYSAPRKPHFTTSYGNARGNVHGYCATCGIEEFNK